MRSRLRNALAGGIVARPGNAVFMVMAFQESEISEDILERRFKRWCVGCGWQRHLHQLEMLTVAVAGRSSLLIAPIWAGKTIACFLPSLSALHRIRRAKKIRDIG